MVVYEILESGNARWVATSRATAANSSAFSSHQSERSNGWNASGTHSAASSPASVPRYVLRDKIAAPAPTAGGESMSSAACEAQCPTDVYCAPSTICQAEA